MVLVLVYFMFRLPFTPSLNLFLKDVTQGSINGELYRVSTSPMTGTVQRIPLKV